MLQLVSEALRNAAAERTVRPPILEGQLPIGDLATSTASMESRLPRSREGVSVSARVYSPDETHDNRSVGAVVDILLGLAAAAKGTDMAPRPTKGNSRSAAPTCREQADLSEPVAGLLEMHRPTVTEIEAAALGLPKARPPR